MGRSGAPGLPSGNDEPDRDSPVCGSEYLREIQSQLGVQLVVGGEEGEPIPWGGLPDDPSHLRIKIS